MRHGSAYVSFLRKILLYRFSPYEWETPHSCLKDSEGILINQFSLLNSLWFTIGEFTLRSFFNTSCVKCYSSTSVAKPVVNKNNLIKFYSLSHLRKTNNLPSGSLMQQGKRFSFYRTIKRNVIFNEIPPKKNLIKCFHSV